MKISWTATTPSAGAAADENIGHSTRATDFISPRNAASRAFRNATLQLARTEPFARALANSGRLSTPTIYRTSPLNTPSLETDDPPPALPPGAPAVDAPVMTAAGQGWLLGELGPFFTLVEAAGADNGAEAARAALAQVLAGPVPCRHLVVGGDPAAAVMDVEGAVARRWGLEPGTLCLVRPDGHLAARWRARDPARITAALARASGRTCR